jgi:hypothetical protein
MENKDYRGKGAKRICRKNINSIIIIKQVLKKITPRKDSH